MCVCSGVDMWGGVGSINVLSVVSLMNLSIYLLHKSNI